MKCIMIVE